MCHTGAAQSLPHPFSTPPHPDASSHTRKTHRAAGSGTCQREPSGAPSTTSFTPRHGHSVTASSFNARVPVQAFSRVIWPRAGERSKSRRPVDLRHVVTTQPLCLSSPALPHLPALFLPLLWLLLEISSVEQIVFSHRILDPLTPSLSCRPIIPGGRFVSRLLPSRRPGSLPRAAATPWTSFGKPLSLGRVRVWLHQNSGKTPSPNYRRRISSQIPRSGTSRHRAAAALLNKTALKSPSWGLQISII